MNSPSTDHRSAWIEALGQVALPVLSHLADGTLKACLPAAKGENASRKLFAPLEAFARTLAGIAPWLEARKTGEAESAHRQKMAELVRAGIAHATDPGSPDYMHFTDGGQPLVDASFWRWG